jgi:hypothetical protein
LFFNRGRDRRPCLSAYLKPIALRYEKTARNNTSFVALALGLRHLCRKFKAAEVFGLGCQRQRSLTSQSEIIAGAAAKSE